MKHNIETVIIKRVPSHPDKKYVAIFKIRDLVDGEERLKEKKTYFGGKGYEDFTIHKDERRKRMYVERHAKDLRTNDPTRAGYLSMFILWNFTSLSKSIQDFKRRLKTDNWTLPKTHDDCYLDVKKRLAFSIRIRFGSNRQCRKRNGKVRNQGVKKQGSRLLQRWFRERWTDQLGRVGGKKQTDNVVKKCRSSIRIPPRLQLHGASYRKWTKKSSG